MIDTERRADVSAWLYNLTDHVPFLTAEIYEGKVVVCFTIVGGTLFAFLARLGLFAPQTAYMMLSLYNWSSTCYKTP